MIYLLTTLILGCCLEENKSVSLFSAIIISVRVALLSKGKGDQQSYLEIVEVLVSSVLQFSSNMFMD